MSTAIETGKVTNRRKLRFNGLDDILADVEQLSQAGELHCLGNWSAGQIIQHLAISMNKSIDGFDWRVPFVLRLLIQMFFKKRLLNQAMPPGFKLNARATAEMVPGETISMDEALANLRQAMQRLQSEDKRSPHPAFGSLTRAEWDLVHCRHSELHLSFLEPVTS
jgi:hypothetical protein